jgi:hypothetical protein
MFMAATLHASKAGFGISALLLLALAPALTRAQAGAPTPGGRTITVHPAVGPTIDAAEKARFGLFPNYAPDDFQEARFVRSLTPDSTITLNTSLRDGRQLIRTCLPVELATIHDIIERRQRELGVGSPQELATAGRPTAPGTTAEMLGRSYSVEVRSGNRFVGVLQAATAETLDFDTPDLGRVHVLRGNLKELVLLNAEQARKGHDYIGNGERLFFGPTARNLRKGEGSVQDIDVFLLTANYGFTDNFSLGVIATFIPQAGTDNLVGLTPKASVPLSSNVRVGVGALALFRGGQTAGVTYANATVGSADNNLTGGLGFGFGSGGFGSTPVFMVGGATRVGKRISLVDETYIVHSGSRNGTLSATGVAGIAGVRVTWPRISGGLGLAYVGLNYNDTYSSGSISNTNGQVLPYLDVAFRFGGVK